LKVIKAIIIIIISAVKADFNDGRRMKVSTLLRDIGTKICKQNHFATPHTGGLSRDDSLCGGLKVRSKCDVRIFASGTLHGKNAIETAGIAMHPALLPYHSREEVSESHRPPSRKRACEEQHDDKMQGLEDSEENELYNFTGSMGALLSL